MPLAGIPDLGTAEDLPPGRRRLCRLSMKDPPTSLVVHLTSVRCRAPGRPRVPINTQLQLGAETDERKPFQRLCSTRESTHLTEV